MIGDIRPIQPVVDVVLRYHGKIPMSLGTGGRRDIAELTIKAVGLSGYFDIWLRRRMWSVISLLRIPFSNAPAVCMRLRRCVRSSRTASQVSHRQGCGYDYDRCQSFL